jgi:ubiquinone/menaquinone biosynthesis C-methylase UbiE
VASFDVVFSSFMLHHLLPEAKDRTLGEVRRVLKPGGFLHLLDLGGPASQPDDFVTRLFRSSECIRDNFEGRILIRMREAGFPDPKEVDHRQSHLGPIAYYQASVPASEVDAA